MLANQGHKVSDTTIKNILKQQGIEPAPTRSKQTTWNDFIRSHTQTMAACDFFMTEVWTKGGLVTFYVLFIIKLATRRVEIAGITASPDSAWIKQVARNLTDCEDGFLNGTTHLLMDRDTKFTGLPADPQIHRRQGGSVAAPESQLECFPGTLRPVNQRRMP